MTIFLRAHDIGEPMPRGTLPASDLIPGDVIQIGEEYPCDLIQVIPRNGCVALYWGYDAGDGMIVSCTTMIDVVGWFEGNVRV